MLYGDMAVHMHVAVNSHPVPNHGAGIDQNAAVNQAVCPNSGALKYLAKCPDLCSGTYIGALAYRSGINVYCMHR
jgi:hypothetical protein